MQLLKGWQHAPRAETARRSTGWRNSVQPVPTRIKRIVPQRPLPLAAMEDIRRLEQATRQSRHTSHGSAAPNQQHMDNIRVSVEVPTTRVYAHVAAETQVALYDPFTNKKRGALDGKYQFNKPIATIDDNAFLEVYPRSSSRQPHLLQQLELLLQDKLHQAEKLASPYGPGHRDPAVAANLRLHAHSEVWDSFISSFGTYQPLMAAIKNEYDTALHKALFASAENMSMRTRLAEAEERKAASVDQAKMEVISNTAGIMLELHNRLVATEERALSAEARARAAEADAKDAMEAAERAKAEAERCRAMHSRMVSKMDQERKWLSRPGSARVVCVKIGTVDGEDVVEPSH